jgi:hypothetical protein
MSELAFFAISLAVMFGLGFAQGYIVGTARAYRQCITWLQTTGDNLNKIISDFQSHLIEREDYHRSIIAWLRGKEKA